MTASANVAVIILTYNEELNLPQALDSVVGWAREVFVVDSLSTDRTVEIARRYGCQVAQHPFEDYAKQRNFALSALPIKAEWIFFLDADEWMPQDLKDEIGVRLASHPVEHGFLVNRRFIWMGRWIRRGYYPTWILRLARRDSVRCEERGVNEHLIVDGPVGRLEHDFVHEDRKGLAEWIAKHVGYAQREAEELLKRRRGQGQREIPARLFGTQAQRKRWLRYHLYERLPPLLRPFAFWGYRYLLRGGFLDGREGFLYHFLQALWFRLLIDAYELQLRRRERLSAPED
ncbi:MAG TPA: glycosyltransferase family 2 protein [Gemmatimonadales bacterium]|nr:glycosyltransferase family 2 protein [Gemmatimonadales bacterium]